jgi:hypothetical protein
VGYWFDSSRGDQSSISSSSRQDQNPLSPYETRVFCCLDSLQRLPSQLDNLPSLLTACSIGITADIGKGNVPGAALRLRTLTPYKEPGSAVQPNVLVSRARDGSLALIERSAHVNAPGCCTLATILLKIAQVQARGYLFFAASLIRSKRLDFSLMESINAEALSFLDRTSLCNETYGLD